MKEKILELLKEHSNYIQPEEGGSYKAIDENDFEELADDLVKLFTPEPELTMEEIHGYKCPYCGPDGTIYGMDNSGRSCDKCNGAGYVKESSKTTKIKLPIEEHWAGDYRLEYDSKYITLFGKDKNYDLEGLMGAPKGTYDEMILIPVVVEVRNAEPVIVEVTTEYIKIDLGVYIELPDPRYGTTEYLDLYGYNGETK